MSQQTHTILASAIRVTMRKSRENTSAAIALRKHLKANKDRQFTLRHLGDEIIVSYAEPSAWSARIQLVNGLKNDLFEVHTGAELLEVLAWESKRNEHGLRL